MTSPLRSALPTDRLPHGWQVAASVLLTGSLFALGWALSEAGLAEMAATGIAFFAVTLARLLGVGLGKRAPKEFARSARMIDQMRADFQNWLDGRAILSRALIAAGYTVAFLILRAVIRAILAVIASPWIALAVGLALAAAVASPVLVRALAETLAGQTGRAASESPEEAKPDADH